MSQLARRGTLVLLIFSGPFMHLARAQAKALGVPDLPLIEIQHPLGGITSEAVQQRAEAATEQARQHIEAGRT